MAGFNLSSLERFENARALAYLCAISAVVSVPTIAVLATAPQLFAELSVAKLLLLVLGFGLPPLLAASLGFLMIDLLGARGRPVDVHRTSVMALVCGGVLAHVIQLVSLAMGHAALGRYGYWLAVISLVSFAIVVAVEATTHVVHWLRQRAGAGRPVTRAAAGVAQPRVGCGAVIQRGDGAVLLVQRGRAPEIGYWALPGGKVDWMETVETTVVREIHEETGLHISVQRLLCLVNHFEPGLTPPQHWVAPVFLARIEGSEEATLREPEALQAVRWFALDNLPSPLAISATQALPLLSAGAAVVHDEAGAAV